jgi:hypothetical protein
LIYELDGRGKLDEEIRVVDIVNVNEEVLKGLAILGEGLVFEIFEAGRVEGD